MALSTRFGSSIRPDNCCSSASAEADGKGFAEHEQERVRDFKGTSVDEHVLVFKDQGDRERDVGGMIVAVLVLEGKEA